MLVFIVAGGGFLVFNHFSKTAQANKSNQPNIDDIVKNLTVDTDEITTNLKTSNNFVKVKFKIQVSNQTTKDELQKRMFQVKNEIIYQLSGMKPSDLQGPTGLNNLETALKKRFNSLLKDGSVVRVYTTEILIQ